MNITQVGNPTLRKKSTPIKDVSSKKTQKIIKELITTMRKQDLIGIAAPQIGYNIQIFITEVRKTSLRKSLKETDPLRIYINPKIISHSRATAICQEGCGSVANSQLFGPVKRSKKITIEAYDSQGNKFSLKAENLLARVIQHEYDHLQEILCIDKFENTKQIMSREEYLKNN